MREAGQRLPEGAFQTHGTALKKKKKSANSWESPTHFWLQLFQTVSL